MASSTLIQARGTAMERFPTPNPLGNLASSAPDCLDEAAIVARAQGDPSAFAPLYQAYLIPVYRYCYRRLGNREAAEDATSLIFERALRALPAFRGESFRSWLFAIAHNAITDAYRRRGTESLADALAIVDPAPPPEQVALVADEQRLLATALALLPADQRHVIELRLSGLSSGEVATILGRSPQAVRALQLRATRRLQALLGISSATTEVRHA